MVYKIFDTFDSSTIKILFVREDHAMLTQSRKLNNGAKIKILTKL